MSVAAVNRNRNRSALHKQSGISDSAYCIKYIHLSWSIQNKQFKSSRWCSVYPERFRSFPSHTFWNRRRFVRCFKGLCTSNGGTLTLRTASINSPRRHLQLRRGPAAGRLRGAITCYFTCRGTLCNRKVTTFHTGANSGPLQV